MAVELSRGINFPEATGAVDIPTGPVVTVQEPGDTATGAVDVSDGPVVTKFGPSGQKPAGAVETPGPVTVRNPAVKVIRAPRRAAAEAATQADTEHDADARTARRVYQPEDDGR